MKKYIVELDESPLDSLKLDFIKKIESEHSLDTIKEWFSMYDEARYAASITSNEPELINYHKEYEKEIKEGLLPK